MSVTQKKKSENVGMGSSSSSDRKQLIFRKRFQILSPSVSEIKQPPGASMATAKALTPEDGSGNGHTFDLFYSRIHTPLSIFWKCHFEDHSKIISDCLGFWNGLFGLTVSRD